MTGMTGLLGTSFEIGLISAIIVSLIIAIISWFFSKFLILRNISTYSSIKKKIDSKDPYVSLEKLNKLIDKDPEFYDAYYQRALLYMKLKNYGYAMVNFTKYIKNKKGVDLSEIFLKRGECYYYMNNFDLALEDFKPYVDLMDDRLKNIYLDICKINK